MGFFFVLFCFFLNATKLCDLLTIAVFLLVVGQFCVFAQDKRY